MRKEVALAAAVTAAATAVAVGVLLRQWKYRSDQRWRHTQRILRKFARDCAAPVPDLWHVAYDLVYEMQNGLASDQTALPMLPAYVDPLPSGEEKGLYYGLNLRGENFLILQARLGGKSEPISELHREEIPIPSKVLGGTSKGQNSFAVLIGSVMLHGEILNQTGKEFHVIILGFGVTGQDDAPKEIFEYIALQLVKIFSEHEENGKNTERTLGFTVSFPVKELAEASAINWKSFSADDTVGKELVKSMNQALKDHNMNTHVFALVDDTVGDLAGGRYYNKDSIVAITLAMGTNAAYVESAQSVTKWNGPTPKCGEMVIDMQWGEFNSSHFPITEFDASLDAESSNPGRRIFEKLISGMYLGEIVRRVLLKMAQETALFGVSVPPKLKTPYSLRSPDMAAMHQDTSEERDVVNEKLEEIFGITNTTTEVREVVAEVCEIVAERGARLAGAGIVGIIKKLERIANKRSIVTVEGGLYEHYRVFRNYLHSSVWEMLGNDLSDNVIIEHSHGGSGAGAIFLAASQTEDNNS